MNAQTWVEWPVSRGGNGHFYALTVNRHLAFADAETEAASHPGGHLASITSATEQEFINQNILVGPNRQRQFWIGLNDIAQEGVYVWTTGEVFNYRNWTIAGGQAWEPNNGANGYYAPDEDAVLLNFHYLLQNDYFGTWNDISVVLPSGIPEQGLMELPTNPLAGSLAISVHPVNRVENIGGTAAFSVTAAGSGILSYQWHRNGTPVSGQTGSSLTISNVTSADAGQYSVRVSNAAGSLMSHYALLTVVTTGAELTLPSQTPWSRFWVADDTIWALLEHDGKLYAGGDFQHIGRQVPGYAVVSLTENGRVLPLSFNGPINAVISDNEGGFYAGGLLNSVNGVSVANIVHVLEGNIVDTGFAVQTDDHVQCMALEGEILYLGGSFRNVGSQARRRLAAVNRHTGALTSWNPDANGSVTSMSYHQGKLLVGGDFGTIGTMPRTGFVAIDPATGGVLNWGPNANESVDVIVPTADKILLGGGFRQLDGVPRNYFAALNLDGSLHPLDPAPDNKVNDILVTNGIIYVAGEFGWIGGQTRRHLAAIEQNSGVLMDWQAGPGTRDSAYQLEFHNGQLHVTGRHTPIDGPPRGYTIIDAPSGSVLETELNLSGGFHVLAKMDGEVYGAGLPGLIRTPRKSVAAFEVATGMGTSFTVPIEGTVYSLARYGNQLVVGGSFTSGGSVTRHNLLSATLDTATVTDWDPLAGGIIRSLTMIDPVLYVGGGFATLGGQLRNNIGAFNLETGELLPWNPNANGLVTAMAARGNTLYVSGLFTAIGGKPRRHLAAVDRITGEATDWDPSPDQPVGGLLAAANWLYAGGSFASIGGK
ncbi:MAG TPA: hypothetical protein DCY13_14365, partial [Verrucomicrobiales bacterium]|nr:hypothetical protein [Verrucomicrobiales bacterium]